MEKTDAVLASVNANGAASVNAGEGAGTPNPGAEGGAVNAVTMSAVHNAINNAFAAKIDRMQAIFAQQMADALKPIKQQQSSEQSESSEKPNVKALQDQLLAMQKQIKAAEEARLEAVRSSAVKSQFEKILGADSPYTEPVFESMYHVKKRFVSLDDGSVGVKIKRDGYEETLPLEQGFRELMESDLKPFLPAKKNNLPPGSFIRGQQILPPKVQHQPNGLNPIFSEVVNGLAQSNPDMAAALYQSIKK